MTYMGKNLKKVWICVYVELIHFVVHLKLTHYKSTMLQLKLFKKRERCEEEPGLGSHQGELERPLQPLLPVTLPSQ